MILHPREEGNSVLLLCSLHFQKSLVKCQHCRTHLHKKMWNIAALFSNSKRVSKINGLCAPSKLTCGEDGLLILCQAYRWKLKPTGWFSKQRPPCKDAIAGLTRWIKRVDVGGQTCRCLTCLIIAVPKALEWWNSSQRSFWTCVMHTKESFTKKS